MNTDKQLLSAATSLLLLAALRRQPSYGYQLVKNLADQSKGLLHWQEGTLYPILHRLQSQRLVTAEWQKIQTKSAKSAAPLKGPRRRRYYALTPKGRRALADQTAHWRNFQSVVNKLLAASQR